MSTAPADQGAGSPAAPQPEPPLGPLLGQGAAWQRALRQARSRTLPHALVIAGSVGSGKSLAARLLAKALLCEAVAGAAEEGACGACSACGLFAAGTHLDLLAVTPAADKRDVSVEQVRMLQDALQLASSRGRARVAVLDPADLLNESGQNALLKTLEEPLAHTFLLLPTARPEQLLPTVRSRAQRLAILPLAPAEVLAGLPGAPAAAGGAENAENFSEQRRHAAAALAQGSLGLARQLLEGGVLELLPRVDQALGGGGGLTPPELAKTLLAGASGRQELERRARLVLLLLRRRVSAQAGLGAGSSEEGGGECSLAGAGGGAYSPASSDRWISRCEALCDAEVDLGLQISPELALAVALQRLR